MSTDITPTLTDWIQKGWSDHADDAEGVMSRFPEAIAMVSEAAQLPQLAGLITHVAANHLAQYQEGLALLDQLERLPCHDAADPNAQSLLRTRAVLWLCAGDEARATELTEASHVGSEFPRASSSVRVKAIAAGALADHGDFKRASALFEEAVALASYGPGKEDMAARLLAITGNNMACTLEVQEERSAAGSALMEQAAKVARTYWEIAGSWEQVKIAEYRLAITFIALGDAEQATAHARLALELCDQNEGTDSDRFFPHEALARARHLAVDSAGASAARDLAARAAETADENNKEWFSSTLTELDERLKP